MKPSEIRELSLEELRHMDEDLRKELFNLNFQLATSQIENPMRVRTVRKDIARVKTILKEKELEAAEKGAGERNQKP